MITKKAIVEWIPRDQGGRSKPPLGLGLPPYSTVVQFTDEPRPHQRGSWSLVVEKDESHSSELKWIANVRYLVEEAPHASLQEGREFELFEGNKCVARGRILAD